MAQGAAKLCGRVAPHVRHREAAYRLLCVDVSDIPVAMFFQFCRYLGLAFRVRKVNTINFHRGLITLRLISAIFGMVNGLSTSLVMRTYRLRNGSFLCVPMRSMCQPFNSAKDS